MPRLSQPLPDHAAEIPALGMPHAAAGQPFQDHAAEIPALGMITERADDALLAAADLAESPLAVAMVKEPTERQIAPSNAKFPHSADHLQDVPPVGRQRVSPVPGQRTQQASGVFGSVASGEAGQARGVSPRSGAQARSGGRSSPGRIAGRRFECRGKPSWRAQLWTSRPKRAERHPILTARPVASARKPPGISAHSAGTWLG